MKMFKKSIHFHNFYVANNDHELKINRNFENHADKK